MAQFLDQDMVTAVFMAQARTALLSQTGDA
jgi:hypothetical protein